MTDESIKDRADYIVEDSLARIKSEMIKLSVWLGDSREKKGIRRLVKERLDEVLEL